MLPTLYGIMTCVMSIHDVVRDHKIHDIVARGVILNGSLLPIGHEGPDRFAKFKSISRLKISL